jgi:hypothetical protein
MIRERSGMFVRREAEGPKYRLGFVFTTAQETSYLFSREWSLS